MLGFILTLYNVAPFFCSFIVSERNQRGINGELGETKLSNRLEGGWVDRVVEGEETAAVDDVSEELGLVRLEMMDGRMSSDRWPVTLDCMLKVEHGVRPFNCGEYGRSMDSDVALELVGLCGDISDIAGDFPFIRGPGKISDLGDSLKEGV